ncbi:MAG: LptF/LptG family permease [Planctomycetota bacterium]
MFAKVLVISFFSLTGLYIVIDLFGNLNEFMSYAGKQQGLLSVLAQYYGPRVLAFVDRTSSLLALLAALFTITRIQRSNELTALMAAGISKARVIRGLVFATTIVALLASVNREIGLPQVRDKLRRNAQNWLGENAERMTAQRDQQTQILLGGKETIAAEKKIIQPIFRLLDSPPHFGRQLVAATATYHSASDDHPSGYLLHDVSQPGDLTQIPSYRRSPKSKPIIFTPKDHAWLKDEQCFVASDITFAQLVADRSCQQYYSTATLWRTLRNPSLDYGANTRVIVHRRFVQPILDVTLLFLGLPLVLTRSQRNMFVAAAQCLLLAGTFFLVSMACESMGNAVMISPALAAWLPVLVFVPLAYTLAARRWE